MKEITKAEDKEIIKPKEDKEIKGVSKHDDDKEKEISKENIFTYKYQRRIRFTILGLKKPFGKDEKEEKEKLIREGDEEREKPE